MGKKTPGKMIHHQCATIELHSIDDFKDQESGKTVRPVYQSVVLRHLQNEYHFFSDEERKWSQYNSPKWVQHQLRKGNLRGYPDEKIWDLGTSASTVQVVHEGSKCPNPTANCLKISALWKFD